MILPVGIAWRERHVCYRHLELKVLLIWGRPVLPVLPRMELWILGRERGLPVGCASFVRGLLAWGLWSASLKVVHWAEVLSGIHVLRVCHILVVFIVGYSVESAVEVELLLSDYSHTTVVLRVASLISLPCLMIWEAWRRSSHRGAR